MSPHRLALASTAKWLACTCSPIAVCATWLYFADAIAERIGAAGAVAVLIIAFLCLGAACIYRMELQRFREKERAT